MKNLTALLFLFSLFSCTKANDKAVLDLIKQNNKYYQTAFEEYQLGEKDRELDNPHNFDKEFHDMVYNSMKAIPILKNRKSYDSLYTILSSHNFSSDGRKAVAPIQSDNVELLKNNLYICLMASVRSFELKRPIGIGTRCLLSDKFKIRKRIEKDSVKLEFYTGNPYALNLDAILDGNKSLTEYTSDKTYTVWSIKCKPKSKEARFKGKIFFRDEYYNSDYIMIQEFDETITK